MRLLIIDDEAHIRHMVRLTLEAAGDHVEEAADGRTGLERFGTGAEFDAVVLDQKMPGMDGLDTLRRITDRAPDACVLMVTAYASIDLAVDAMRLGATDFLRKPMTPETLRGAVAAALDGRSRRSFRKPAASRATGPLEIATLTMNGFQILRAPDLARSGSAAQLFLVKHVADNTEAIATVTIDPEAIERVERLTHRRLEATSGFWRLQAERLLSAWIWTEGRAPTNPLVVRDISREDLEVASRWTER